MLGAVGSSVVFPVMGFGSMGIKFKMLGVDYINLDANAIVDKYWAKVLVPITLRFVRRVIGTGETSKGIFLI